MSSNKTKNFKTKRLRPINVKIPQLISTLEGYPVSGMVQQVIAVASRPSIPADDKGPLCKRALEILCKEQKETLILLRPLNRAMTVLITGSEYCPDVLEDFTLNVFSVLARDIVDEYAVVSSEDVHNCITLLAYNKEVTPALARALLSVEEVVLNEIPSIKNSMALLRTIPFAALRPDKNSTEVASMKILESLVLRLSKSLNPNIPPRREQLAVLHFDVAAAIQGTGYRHGEFIAKFSSVVSTIITLNAMKTPLQASQVAYMCAYYGHSDSTLFGRIRKAMDDRRRTQLATGSISVYVRLCWAFHAVNERPPQSIQLAMQLYFRSYSFPYDPSIARETQMLASMLQDSKTDLRELMLTKYRQNAEHQEVIAAVSASQPNCLTNVWLKCGVTPVVGLVPENRVAFDPWPANVPPEDVDPSNAKLVSGQPTALFLVEAHYMLCWPHGQWCGVVETQRRILVGRGWKVTIVPMHDLVGASVEDSAKRCISLMLRSWA